MHLPDQPIPGEFTRIRSRFPVILECSEGRRDGSTADLGMQGALIEVADPPSTGTEVRIMILLGGYGGSPNIHALGSVVRTGPRQCVVAFVDLVGEESYHHLSRLIRYHAVEPALVGHPVGSRA